jgi:hypothetical protein
MSETMKEKASAKKLEETSRDLALAASQAQAAGRDANKSEAALRLAKQRYKSARRALKRAKKAARKARKTDRKTHRKLKELLAKQAKLKKGKRKPANPKARRRTKVAQNRRRTTSSSAAAQEAQVAEVPQTVAAAFH